MVTMRYLTVRRGGSHLVGKGKFRFSPRYISLLPRGTSWWRWDISPWEEEGRSWWRWDISPWEEEGLSWWRWDISPWEEESLSWWDRTNLDFLQDVSPCYYEDPRGDDERLSSSHGEVSHRHHEKSLHLTVRISPWGWGIRGLFVTAGCSCKLGVVFPKQQTYDIYFTSLG